MRQARQKKHRHVFARRLLGAAAILVVAVTLLGLWGCTTTITPPPAADIADAPATVFVADYGRHSSLLLPLGETDDRMVEYAYGEWEWFAMNRTGPFHAIRALCVRSQGTIGRRVIDGPFDEDRLRIELSAVNLYTFDVHRDEATGLRVRLDQRYEGSIETEVYNPRFRLNFVQVDEPYTLRNNCNPVLARWLEELGCDLRGPALLSSWRVAAPVEPEQ